MAPLPAGVPDTDRRWVHARRPDPYLRVDTNDYSLDPRLVGRRVEVTVDQRRSLAGGAGHRRAGLPARASFAKHRTITALEHARALKRASAATRRRRAGGRGPLAGAL